MLLIFFLVLLVFVMILHITKDTPFDSIYEKNVIGNATNNISNRGKVAVQGEWVYFGKHCYRMNLFDKKTEYVTDVAWHIIVSDDAIYYVSYDESTIFKYDIVQQTTSEIAKNVERVNYMIVINDKLYYRNGIGNSLQVLDLYTLETDELFISGDIYSFDNEPYIFHDNKLEKLDFEF